MHMAIAFHEDAVIGPRHDHLRQDCTELAIQRREIANHITVAVVLAGVPEFPSLGKLRPDVLIELPGALGHLNGILRKRKDRWIAGFDAVLHREADGAIGVDDHDLAHTVVVGDPSFHLVSHEFEFGLAAIEGDETVERRRRLVHRPFRAPALIGELRVQEFEIVFQRDTVRNEAGTVDDEEQREDEGDDGQARRHIDVPLQPVRMRPAAFVVHEIAPAGFRHRREISKSGCEDWLARP